MIGLFDNEWWCFCVLEYTVIDESCGFFYRYRDE